jgi:hypothetical protein
MISTDNKTPEEVCDEIINAFKKHQEMHKSL